MRKKLFQSWFTIFIICFFVDYTKCVSVHFENKDGGFFLKQSSRQHATTSTLSDVTDVLTSNGGSPLSTDRFTVFQSSQPISIRATYGPFSTKQTVPARYVVPDPLPINATGPSIDLQDLATHHLDMSAHIVRNEIPRDSPVLRVLFHTGSDLGTRHQVLLNRHQQKVCIVLHALLNGRPPLHAACSPDGEDGVCLAQITIPSSYWPTIPLDKNGRLGKATKTPPRILQIGYSVLEPRPDKNEGCHPKMQIQPTTSLGVVHLVAAKGAYKELKLTDDLFMLVPHPPLFPMSRMHIPVYIDKKKSKLLTAIVIRGRVKSGIKILSADPSGAVAWNMTVDINPRHTLSTVTLVRKEPPDAESSEEGEIMELFSWLIEISEDATELHEGTRIVWSARFEPHQDQDQDRADIEMHRSEGKKSTTRFEVQKDDIQAVVPISKNWEVLNTAVLTGRQVSQAMKIFIVSQAGKAADVTFQASCQSEDDSVLKVSSSCSSVYVDGSEARGSVNGSVVVKYGTYTGLARFTVWMPEFALDLQVADVRLSQIKSWRVLDHSSTSKIKRRKRSYSGGWGSTSSIPDDLGNVIEKPNCKLRYQQTPVEVYAHFMAVDHESGRQSYLINRRTWLRVTDLVLPSLRVSDPRIASLHGRILQGRSMGRTEVQVLSPITGRVIGAKEIRVVNDKVGISKLSVEVVSGLQLNISPDGSIENGYVAETSVTRKLTAQYQEGLLDIELEFSDGNKTPLRDISDSDYHLVVESLDPEVVAFAPMVASRHPRVIAVGEGSGDLLQVTLLLSEDCRMSAKSKIKTGGPLATSSASVEVDFTSSDLSHRPDILQNDGGGSPYGGPKVLQDLQDILQGGNSIKENINQEPNVQARQYSSSRGHHKKREPENMNPLEISMYVLLAAFCCAIIVFVVSCVIYASKYKQIESGVVQGVQASPIALNSLPSHQERKRETTMNVHDWVWLGRSTVDSNRNSSINPQSNEMRITTNPLNANYCDPEDCLVTSFSNPNHVNLSSVNEAEPNANRVVDSSTYTKNKYGKGSNNYKNESQIWYKPIPPPPPPLPLHGLQLQQPSERPLSKIEAINNQNQNDDYKPPVPPHRNLVSTPNKTPSKKHYAQKNMNESKNKARPSSQEINTSTALPDYSRPSDPTKVPSDYGFKIPTSNKSNKDSEESSDYGFKDFVSNRNRDIDGVNVDNMESAFEFDDEPCPLVQNVGEGRNKNEKKDFMEFVQYPNSPGAGIKAQNSAEVKKATIVGNPMYSTEENSTALPADLPVLDDLQLDMDYEQIMHYFENLKESNA